MIITQDNLIKQIADREAINIATVRDVFEATENIIFDQLSSVSPSENIIIKILKGISLERTHIEKKKYSKGMFKNIDCPEHVKVKASSSKYFSKKINDELISKNILN